MSYSKVYISLGSNLGDSRLFLEKAVEAINEIPEARVLRVSGVYRTEPVDDTDQPWFHNQVVELECQYEAGGTPAENAKKMQLAAIQLLFKFMHIENTLGRKRDANRRFGPRNIDIDMLMFDGLGINTQRLTLPHPRMLERAFVLVPLAELVPDTPLQNGKTAAEALKDLTYRLEGDKIFQS